MATVQSDTGTSRKLVVLGLRVTFRVVTAASSTI